ncbi:TIGR04104 family putative zinc finger protein [Lentibacillus jeotgali]|uniref:TIGR04104 family putative zinc finger protein n=1 Tax=Lentibacillus jeotgali TaxID=558169 RepID=UPI000262587A|nr:TIGR04104 family putative zinc finger protein [Lentibacillus jeotgali]
MPTCQNCHEQWSWAQTVKVMFTLDVRLTCPYCGQKQHLTTKARKQSSILNFVVPVALFLALMLEVPPLASFAILVGGALVAAGIYPFLIELTNQAEPGWE